MSEVPGHHLRDLLPDEHNMSLGRPRFPVWVVNAGIVVLIACLWPLSGWMKGHLDDYYLRILILIGINIILVTSLNLINGITGQFSLGHAGFMAIGAYVTGALIRYWRPTEAVSIMALPSLLALGGVISAMCGLAVGIPALRLRGDYLAIATLGFGEIIAATLVNIERIGPVEVGGSAGLHGIPIIADFAWVWGGAVLCVVCVWRLAYSTKGIAFRAVREDEIAAAAMGIDTTYYKVAAFAVGAFFAGIAGGLSATFNGDLDPESFRFMKSIEVVVMVVLGGSGSITGGVLAAVVLTFLPENLRFFDDYRMVIYSLLLILMMLLRPAGLLGSRELWWRRRRLKFAPAPARGEPGSG